MPDWGQPHPAARVFERTYGGAGPRGKKGLQKGRRGHSPEVDGRLPAGESGHSGGGQVHQLCDLQRQRPSLSFRRGGIAAGESDPAAGHLFLYLPGGGLSDRRLPGDGAGRAEPPPLCLVYLLLPAADPGAHQPLRGSVPDAV